MKKVLLNVVACVATLCAFGQVSTNGGSGLAVSYPSFADAITALNAATISSPVIITATGITEVAPAGGYMVTAQGTAVNTIELVGTSSTLRGNGSKAAGSLSDAVIKLVGADYVTVRDFIINENAANLTTDPGTNNMTEWGVAILAGTSNNGAKNVAILNNTISLNKAYANSFGIYASTAHSSTDVATPADITNASGGNDNLSINKNSISNVNIPISVVGSPAFPGLGLVIGSGSGNGNTLTDWGTTGTYSSFARFNNQVNAVNGATFFNPVMGIQVVNQVAPSILYNSITSATAGAADGLVIGIYAPTNGAITYPGSSYTSSFNNNTLSLSSAVSGASTTPLIQGIRVMTGDNNNTINVNNNNFTAAKHTANAIGADTLIYSFAQPATININNNQFTNLVFENTGTIMLIGFHGRVFMPANGAQNINGNSISGTLTRSTTAVVASNLFLISRPIIPSAVATDGSESGSTFTAQNNNFSNIITNGGAVTGIQNFDGKQSPNATLAKIVSNNTIANINTNFGTTSAGGVNALQFTNRGVAHTIESNTLQNITADAGAGGALNGIIFTQVGSGMSATINDNLIQNWTGAGVACISASVPTANITNNNIYNITGKSGVAAGVAAISSTAFITGSTVTISGNKIGNISNSTGNFAYGMSLAAGNLANTVALALNNNLIGDIKAPASPNVNAVLGIQIGSGAFTSDIAYNTIYLNASSSAITFGSSCIAYNNNNTSNTLRNNSLINLSTPALEGANTLANGASVALRVIGTGMTAASVPANYGINSNNNLFYVNSAAGTNNHLVYLEGAAAPFTDQQNSLADFKTFMVNRDQSSVTDNNTNPFQSLVASSANFLHLNTGITYAASNAGVGIPAITIDYDGDTRNSTTPDIGADEYEVVLPVSLVSLSGVRQGTSNLLTWVTRSEQNNRGFDIQRSVNGTNFSTISTVASKAAGGNSNSMLTYEFTDAKVAGGDTYYRLVQTDLDGKTKLSNTVLIAAAMPAVSKLQGLFPNPASSNLSLYISSVKQDRATITVVDAAGRILQRQNASLAKGYNTVNINVNSFKAGLYFVSVQLAESKGTETLRFVKQ